MHNTMTITRVIFALLVAMNRLLRVMAIAPYLLGGALTTYGAAFVVHDFTIKNGLTLVSGGEREHLSKDGGRTFGQVAVGVSYRASSGAITFAEAGGDYGGGRHGGGLRIGARFGF